MALLPDVNDIVGVPFVDRGRDMAGLDCWGVLCVVYARMGIDLPSHAEGYQTVADKAEIAELIEGGLPSWREVIVEQPTDAILFRSAGRSFHVGVVVRPGFMLHTAEKTGALIEAYRSPAFQRRILGFYRHECFDHCTA